MKACKADTPVRSHRSPFPIKADRSVRLRVLLALACHATLALAAPPALETLFPCGGKAGASTTITATGSNLDKGHPNVWADHPGIVFKPGEKPKTFAVTIAPDVPPGPHLVRFFNAEGASAPHVFVVGTHDEVSDAEPNNDHLASQRIDKLPVAVHGRLEKSGDVDTFAVQLESGRTFAAEMQGYALGSQMDPAMKLLDASGVEVALSHDTHNLDPFIRFEVKKTGIYFVQIMAFAHPPAADVTLKGSAGHIYRLTLTDQPFARSALPCGVQRGQTAKVATNHGEATVDATHSIAGERRIAVPTPAGEPVFAALVSSTVALEKEPNDDRKVAQRLTAPCAVSGIISRSGDEDRYVFSARKGESHVLRIHAAVVHSPLDAALRVEDSEGKVLQQDDDSDDANPDPSLAWKAPEDGDFIAVVHDLFQRGGPDFCYALEISPPAPTITATLASNALNLDAGKTAELKTTVKITGKPQGKLLANVIGLPNGVTVKEAEVPAKGGEVKLPLTAAADAAAANGPVELQIVTSPPDGPMIFKASYDLRGTEPRGDRLINEDSRVWLTVTPAKAPPAAASSPSASAKPQEAAPAAKP